MTFTADVWQATQAGCVRPTSMNALMILVEMVELAMMGLLSSTVNVCLALKDQHVRPTPMNVLVFPAKMEGSALIKSMHTNVNVDPDSRVPPAISTMMSATLTPVPMAVPVGTA